MPFPQMRESKMSSFNELKKRPKKSLGQHFLHDKSVIQKIVSALKISTPRDPILEIGPGRGALTQEILTHTQNLTLLEKDREMIAYLKELEFIQSNSIPIVEGDATEGEKIDEALSLIKTKTDEEIAIVSNLPYNVSTLILYQLLTRYQKLPTLVLMFQKEVAIRIASPPGSKKYGSLSVLAQNWYEVTRVLSVKPGAFTPPPEIDSLVLKFSRRKTPIVPLTEAQFPLFEKMLRAAFSHRRKSIKNSLHYTFTSSEYIENALQEAGISGSRRAESVSIQEFGKLLHCLQNHDG